MVIVMNKEEIALRLVETWNDCYSSEDIIEKYHYFLNELGYIDDLEKELQKANDTLDNHNEMINNLQNKIDKAIKFLENSFISDVDGVDEEVWKVIEILKGESNE